MHVPSIKKLIETYSLEELEMAETQLLEESPVDIEIGGENEGEQLTHVMGAIWILKKVKENDIPQYKAIRLFIEKVRNSIS